MLFNFLGSKRKGQTAKISKEFIKSLSQISLLISKGKRNEEETRRWCVDILKSAFGWNSSEIETELSVLGKRVDIALKDSSSNRVLVVIECKAATVSISNAAINQAASYTTALNAEWAVVTNGHEWFMFHVSPTTTGIEPDMMQIFDVALLDDDGVSKEDVGELYLLTKNAITSGETLSEFHNANVANTCNDVRGNILNIFNNRERRNNSPIVGINVIDTAQIMENSKIRLCEASIELSNNTSVILAYLIEGGGFSDHIRAVNYKDVEKEYNVKIGDALNKKEEDRKAAAKPSSGEKSSTEPVYADDDIDVTQPFTACWRWAEPMIEKRKCLTREVAYADKALNEEYQKLMKSLPENAKRNLRERQRDWIKARDTKCGVDRVGKEDPMKILTDDDFEKSAEINMCVGTTTAQRVEELRMMMPK